MIKTTSYWSMKHGLAGNHPISEALSSARESGFDGLELCIGIEGVFTPQSTRSECEAMRRQIEDSGVVVQTVASGMTWALNPISNEDSVRLQALQLNKAALERAAWLGVEAYLYVPGVVKSPICPGELVRYDRAMQRCREAVASLVETAERVGVDLCLENVWNGMFYSPIELIDFIDSFESDRLGVYFDVGNCLGYQQHPPHWIELLGNRIKRVHIKDYKENFDWQGSYSFCDLGEGDVPWDGVVRALQDLGYNKTLVAEMMPWDETLLARTSSAMERIFGARAFECFRLPSRGHGFR